MEWSAGRKDFRKLSIFCVTFQIETNERDGIDIWWWWWTNIYNMKASWTSAFKLTSKERVFIINPTWISATYTVIQRITQRDSWYNAFLPYQENTDLPRIHWIVYSCSHHFRKLVRSRKRFIATVEMCASSALSKRLCSRVWPAQLLSREHWGAQSPWP